jgi:hypothetical protein
MAALTAADNYMGDSDGWVRSIAKGDNVGQEYHGMRHAEWRK